MPLTPKTRRRKQRVRAPALAPDTDACVRQLIDERLRRMYTALTALNETILRARTAEDLYQRVCNAAVESGQFFAANVYLIDPGSTWVRLVASRGFDRQEVDRIRISIDPDVPEGRGLFATACRTREPCISNDYRKDQRTVPWHVNSRDLGFRAVAVVPIVRDRKAFGGLIFYSHETDAFDEDIVQLLRRMAENVVFALENFERDAERRAAEQAVRTSEEKHRNVLANMSEGYFEVDLKGNYTFFNEALRRMHGLPRDELMGLNYRAYYEPESITEAYRLYNEVYRTGKSIDLVEWNFTRRDGTRGTWEQSVQRIDDADGKPIGFRGVVRDTTDRRRAEQALRESEEKHRAILENMHDGYFEVDLKGNYTFFNDAMCRIHRCTRPELLNSSYRRFVPDAETVGKIFRAYNEIYRTRKPVQMMERPFKRADGSVGVVQSSVQLIYEDGKPIGFRGLARDITERKLDEEALRESEEKYRDILQNMSDGYFEVDLKGDYTFFNDAMCRIHRCARDELMGVNYRSYAVDKDTADRVFRVYNKIYRTGKPMQMTEWSFKRKDGTLGVWQSSVQLIVDKDGKPIGFRGVTRDITERKRAEEALRESEEKYRTILESIEDAYYEVNLKGDLVLFNSAFCRMLGYSEHELLGMNNREYQSPEVATSVYKAFNQVYRTGIPAIASDWELQRKDGCRVLVEGSVQLIKDGGGRPIGFRGMIRDVTARRQMEIALRASEERFRSLTDLSSDWFWEQDGEFRFTKFEGKKVAGGRFDLGAVVLGKLPWELPHVIADSVDWEQLREIYRQRTAIHDLEYCYADSKGRRYYINVNGEPMFDEAGNFKGYRGTSRDITKRKREERLLTLEHAVTRSLAGSDSTRKTLQVVLSAICESEQWQASGFWYVDTKIDLLRLAVGWSAKSADAKTVDFYRRHGRIAVPANGLLGAVWKTGKPQWVRDVAEESSSVWRERIDATRERSTFCFPAVSGGKVIGVFAFASNVMREPDDRLLQAANVIGNQVGQFLQRKQAEDVLRESETRFRALTDLSSDWYWEQDAELRFTRVESRRDDITSAREHLLGKRLWETDYQIESADGGDAHRQDLTTFKAYRDVVMFRHFSDGTLRYISVSGEPIFDSEGQFTGYRGVARDITKQKLAEARIQYLATHDALTDTPNRFMFNQLLAVAIESAKRYDRKFAVLFIDLDRFKVINDTLGHAAGDTLLKEMSLRLNECLRGSDIVARLGGDEFVVLLQAADEPQRIVAVAHKLLSRIGQPLSIAGQECRVTGSIGISMYPGDGDDEETLMKNADIAMYLAKEEGKNNFQFYSGDMRAKSLERLALETNLRRALEQHEFSLHCQAKVDLASDAIVGVEALLRWHNPALGTVSPAQFIPIAEETGLIVSIGRWVLRSACAQSVAWQRQGLPPVCMAVNLSARQFADENLVDDIKAALAESGLAPDLLELELTEGMVMQNVERANRVLRAIKALGVRLAIDDFGTGYSSLAQIKRYPIDTLKIDRSFIQDLPQDAEDRAITEAIIAMGKTLGLTVVAEGVETREQAQFLREHACDQMQGFYFSKPIVPDEFAALLRHHDRATGR